MRREYSFEERHERACLRAAMNIRGLWEEKGSSNTRLIEGLLLPDDFTVVGHSRAFSGQGRREHVIPRLVVIKEVHDMLERGATDAQIAIFIRDHVKIVRISNEECSRLDRKDQLGLRQRMAEHTAPRDADRASAQSRLVGNVFDALDRAVAGGAHTVRLRVEGPLDLGSGLIAKRAL